ncbi:MAG: hypothetical protein EDX89_24030 [Acidobacteria bacterium]|nr:MAG: hypothetical protein EDX89_24030 [Acidobacteriota bacterium]MCE7957222.1 hypothetical protein [Acidobacteria bacterium ACB2]
MECRELPASPLVAFLYRRYETINDALRYWRVDCPRIGGVSLDDARQRYQRAVAAADRLLADASSLPPPSVDPGKVVSVKETMAHIRRVEALADERMGECVAATGCLLAVLRFESAAARRAAADRLLAALGAPPDYARGRAELAAILSELGDLDAECNLQSLTPELMLRMDLEADIDLLFDIYEKPQVFFRDIAPGVWPFDFAELGADTRGGKPHPGILAELARPALPAGMHRPVEVVLLKCLWRWGLGVLQNPHVRMAFDNLSEVERGEILSVLDGKITFSDGRPQGTGLTPEETRETYQAALAHVEDTTPKERAEDRSIYGDEAAPRVPPRRNPSEESAARELASRDLETSRRSLRRHLRKLPKSSD